MVIFSRWQPDGGYDYYEADEFAPLGNDLPNPAMPAPTKLGVPSVEVGTPIPRRARLVGSGDVAVGIVAPMDVSRLGSIFGPADEGTSSAMTYALIGAAVVGATWGVVELVRWSSR